MNSHLLVFCKKCNGLREGMVEGDQVVCIVCKEPSIDWHEIDID